MVQQNANPRLLAALPVIRQGIFAAGLTACLRNRRSLYSECESETETEQNSGIRFVMSLSVCRRTKNVPPTRVCLSRARDFDQPATQYLPLVLLLVVPQARVCANAGSLT
jgi:hypothetical protein